MNVVGSTLVMFTLQNVLPKNIIVSLFVGKRSCIGTYMSCVGNRFCFKHCYPLKTSPLQWWQWGGGLSMLHIVFVVHFTIADQTGLWFGLASKKKQGRREICSDLQGLPLCVCKQCIYIYPVPVSGHPRAQNRNYQSCACRCIGGEATATSHACANALSSSYIWQIYL